MKLPAILAALVTAALFEAQTALATQDKAVRAVSPWQDDPYDVFVSFALVAVPLLGVVIAARLLAWRAPGAPDRAQQTVRAAAALTAVAGLALAAEWGAVAVRAHAPAWTGTTTALIAGLAAQTLLSLAAAAALWRARSPRGAARAWRHDWLGDAALLARRLPLARRWATTAAVEATRRHATAVFAGAGLLAAAGVTAGQAIGEGITDPLLIAWVFTVVATTQYTFCVLTNAAAGFIARPPRPRTARRAEASLLAGAVALMLTTAFRDPLWEALTGHPVGTVPLLVALTVGAGLTAAATTAGITRYVPSRPGNPLSPTPSTPA